MTGAQSSTGALASFVRAMGRGPSRGRSLERGEAAEAMRRILKGEAAPEAVGALLMLMRYRGETAAEIAGFVDAMRARTTDWAGLSVDLDWPSYAAGRSRGLPWFLLSARLVAQSGVRVLIHGWNSHQHSAAAVRDALGSLGIPIAATPVAAEIALQRVGIAYAPVEAIDPELLSVLRLREVLGLRSAVNTCLRVLNPAAASGSVQGVFHPPYRTLQQEACALLGQQDMLVIKGGGGEFERHPSKAITLFGLRNGAPFTALATARVDEARCLADEQPDPARLAQIWTGAADDPFAEAVILGTAGLALLASRRATNIAAADALAADLWRNRMIQNVA